MKALPVILILIAAAVLFWVASNRPDSTGTGEGAEGPAGHSQAGGDAGTQQAGNQEGGDVVVPPKAIPSGSVHGSVRNANGGAVAAIEVSLVDASGATVASTRSGADGTWSFPTVHAGSYQLVARDPDSLYTLLSSPKINHGASSSTQADLFADRGTGYVEGVITTRAGAPLAAEPVEIQSVERPEMTIRVLTGNKGNYRVGGLSAGAWQVKLPKRDVGHTVQIDEGGSAHCDLPVVLMAGLTVHLATPGDVALEGTETVKVVPHVSTVEAWAEAHADELPEAGPERAAFLRQKSKDLTQESTADERGEVVFRPLFPGRYEVRAVFAQGSVQEISSDGSVNLRLEEGQSYEHTLSTVALQKGSALHVPMLVKLILAAFIGVLFLLPMILMPKPVMPNRPQGSGA